MTAHAIAIDWSGAQKDAHRKIWLAEAVDGQLLTLEAGRGREQIADYLIERARRNEEFILGLDFAFSLPAWFLEEQGLTSALRLWSLASREGETWLRACEPPFWGRPGRKKPVLPEHFRRTDMEMPVQAGIRPLSVFQIGGAGAVGTGSVRGMPILHRLHTAGFSVWPFDPPGWPRVIEIYPRVLTGPVTKSSVVKRAAYLRERYPTMSSKHFSHAKASDDAFDAAVSALVMASHVADLIALPAVPDPQLLLEGVIWQPEARPPTTRSSNDPVYHDAMSERLSHTDEQGAHIT